MDGASEMFAFRVKPACVTAGESTRSNLSDPLSWLFSTLNDCLIKSLSFSLLLVPLRSVGVSGVAGVRGVLGVLGPAEVKVYAVKCGILS